MYHAFSELLNWDRMNKKDGVSPKRVIAGVAA
jgi:hypothetical protein